MKKRKLNYRFHNPNSAEDTAEFLCKILIEANAGKVERAIEEEAALKCAGEREYIEVPEKVEVMEEEGGEEREEQGRYDEHKSIAFH